MSKLLFWVSEKWPKLHIFVPRGQLEPQRSMFSTRKRCLIGSLIYGNQKFYPIPPKNGFLAQKRPYLAQNWYFRPNIGMFGPFDTIPDQRAMQTSCLGSFSVIWVPKLLLTSARNWIFWPKNSQICPKTVIFGQISAFFAHLIPCPTKSNANKVPRWFVHYEGTKTFAFSCWK